MFLIQCFLDIPATRGVCHCILKTSETVPTLPGFLGMLSLETQPSHSLKTHAALWRDPRG